MRHNQPLLSYPLSNKVNSGISQQSTQGLVTEYECREACIFGNYNWTTWLDSLTEEERAKTVAHYRLHASIEANVADAHAKHMERQQARASRRRR